MSVFVTSVVTVMLTAMVTMVAVMSCDVMTVKVMVRVR